MPLQSGYYKGREKRDNELLREEEPIIDEEEA
jgi:hypothetical protein